METAVFDPVSGQDRYFCYAPLRCAKVCPLVAFGSFCATSVELAALDLETCLTPEDTEVPVAALLV